MKTTVQNAGKLGGLKRAANLTKQQRAEAARKAALARWMNKRTEIVETVDGEYMVLIDGVQQGGTVDASGAGNQTFTTEADAARWAKERTS